MKKYILTIVSFFWLGCLFAQKDLKQSEGFYTDLIVEVDGKIDEWKDKMIAIGSDSAWMYAVSVDQHNLYVAMLVRNRALQNEAVQNGFALNINTEGRQRDGEQLFYPIPDRESVREHLSERNSEDQDVRLVFLDKVRGYYVRGFDNILDGLLSFENNYGVRAISKIDSEDNLVYESKIPLKSLLWKDSERKIAVQIGVNTLWSQIQRANRRNRNSSIRSPSGKNPYDFKTDIWLSAQLNNN